MNRKYFFLFLCWLVSITVNAQEYQTNIPVHDPVMIKQDSVYYLFCTGQGYQHVVIKRYDQLETGKAGL